MKLIKVKKGDVQYSPKTKAQADAVYNHLLKEYQDFVDHLLRLSELVHLIQGADVNSRQQLSKNMVAMANSMDKTWAGITKEYRKL